MQRIKRNMILKKIKVKILKKFIINKKTLNAKTFEKNENNVQSILYRRVMNKFFENNY